jgi:hypothetical protein
MSAQQRQQNHTVQSMDEHDDDDNYVDLLIATYVGPCFRHRK